MPRNRNSNILLTSVGPTTEAMQERLLELAKTANENGQPKVLLVTDGWVTIPASEGSTLVDRLAHRAEAKVMNAWTRHFIRHILGRVAITPTLLGHLDEQAGSDAIEAHDMIVVPGGNTYQTMRGLRAHRSAIHRHVAQGRPYVGISAGSIVAGRSTRPAAIEPADKRPISHDAADHAALGLLDFDIAPHAAGRTEAFELPGLLPRFASVVSSAVETPSDKMNEFVSLRNSEDVEVKTLHDREGLSIVNGIIDKI